MKQELLQGLTEEQIQKVKACKSQEEMLKLAKEEGIELTDEQLKAVSGGSCFSPERCPRCQSDQVVTEIWDRIDNGVYKGKWQNKKCKSCGYTWDAKPRD